MFIGLGIRLGGINRVGPITVTPTTIFTRVTDNADVRVTSSYSTGANQVAVSSDNFMIVSSDDILVVSSGTTINAGDTRVTARTT